MKEKIDKKNQNIFVNEREIWWCNLGLNVGYEQDDKNYDFVRPVLIIKRFNKKVVLMVPLSTRIKNNKYYYKFNFNNKVNSVILLQIRLIDTKRLDRRIGTLPMIQFKKITKAIKDLIP